MWLIYLLGTILILGVISLLGWLGYRRYTFDRDWRVPVSGEKSGDAMGWVTYLANSELLRASTGGDAQGNNDLGTSLLLDTTSEDRGSFEFMGYGHIDYEDELWMHNEHVSFCNNS